MSPPNSQAKWIMNNPQDEESFPQILNNFNAFLESLLQEARSRDILPSRRILVNAAQSLPASLPCYGFGLEHTMQHLVRDIAPAVSSSSLSPRYFGFVTGGTTPAARLADYLVTTLDECVAVRLPSDTIASDIENRSQLMLSELLSLDSSLWNGFFTPGSSTSNLYGIACGREHVLRVRGASSPASIGIQEACDVAGVRRVQIICSMAHPSIMKAASLIGLGRGAVKQLGLADRPWHLDMDRLERELEDPENASIVSVSLGEVNSGKFGITPDEFQQLRMLCDRHQAWLHVDGAFGIFANILPGTPEFRNLKEIAKCALLADSITGDGHKLLNVPFDCGFFFIRDLSYLKDIFSIPRNEFQQFAIPPVYFSRSLPAPGGPPNPTDVGIQNARRFRALPVYASLVAYGRSGYEDMVVRQTSLARGVAAFILDHPAYDLLPQMPGMADSAILETVFMLVLFRANDPALNEDLLVRINDSGKLYAQGVVWEGQKAIRCAIANWSVHVPEDLEVVTEVLTSVAARWGHTSRSRL